MTFRKTTIALTSLILVAGLLSGFLLGQTTSVQTVVSTFKEQIFSTVTTIRTEMKTVTATVEPREPLVKYAKLFTLERHQGYTLLRDGINRTILLVPRGAPVPQIKADLVVRTPVEKVLLQSSTHVAVLERLREYSPEVLDRVAGIMWGQSYEWYFPEVARRLADGRIKDVGSAFSPDYERILALRPDLVMIYTFPGDPVISKLAELKLPYVVNSEYLETHPLGRFEWIKFVAAFFNLEDAAEKIFRTVEINYVYTTDRAKHLVEKGYEKQMKIVWFSVFRGTVYVAGGGSYVGKALEELGAVYVFKDLKTTGSATVSVEELVARAVDADVIVLSTDLIVSVDALLKEIPQLSQTKPVRENRVYRYNPNIFQLSLYEPEKWFNEIAEILYPTKFDIEMEMFSPLR
ncbi:MAG: ABC transporter substrate-binding protein [Candidatus Caldarchaeum sp.]|nr:ABC transporter substrate-binding protein [Candidatus Caldarchaeum sp.]MDW8435851.1 ABC transporter substrate-binding protein [Candidatus Caldarchaeum sp.]